MRRACVAAGQADTKKAAAAAAAAGHSDDLGGTLVQDGKELGDCALLAHRLHVEERMVPAAHATEYGTYPYVGAACECGQHRGCIGAGVAARDLQGKGGGRSICMYVTLGKGREEHRQVDEMSRAPNVPRRYSTALYVAALRTPAVSHLGGAPAR